MCLLGGRLPRSASADVGIRSLGDSVGVGVKYSLRPRPSARSAPSRCSCSHPPVRRHHDVKEGGGWVDGACWATPRGRQALWEVGFLRLFESLSHASVAAPILPWLPSSSLTCPQHVLAYCVCGKTVGRERERERQTLTTGHQRQKQRLRRRQRWQPVERIKRKKT